MSFKFQKTVSFLSFFCQTIIRMTKKLNIKTDLIGKKIIKPSTIDIFKAIEIGNLEAVNEYIKQGGNVDSKDK